MLFDRFTNIKEISDDIYFLAHGYDMNAIEKERRKIREQKKKEEKENRVILSFKWKAVIIIICVFMLLLNIVGIIYNAMDKNFVLVLCLFINMFIDVVTLICAVIKNKKTEIVSIVGTVIIIFITLFIL